MPILLLLYTQCLDGLMVVSAAHGYPQIGERVGF
jgi:hypothetical protein